jgi:hypothetical protein
MIWISGNNVHFDDPTGSYANVTSIYGGNVGVAYMF